MPPPTDKRTHEGQAPAARGKTGWLLTGLALALVASCAAPRVDDPYFSVWKRIEIIREVAESLRYEAGEYPSDLAAICADSSRSDLLCDSSGDLMIRDRWGGEIWYEPTTDRYRIGSYGPDGERNTADDLEIDYAVEHERVIRSAGCYLIEPDDLHNHIDRLLVLDTARIDFLSSERRAWGGSPAYFERPKWHPWRHDSLVVTWARPRDVVDLRLLPRADSLSGVLHSPTGYEKWWDHALPFSVVAVRVDCEGI